MIEYRPIPGIPKYLAGSDGHIYSTKGQPTPIRLAGHYDKDGYHHVSIRLRCRSNPKRFGVHRLVSLAFHGPPTPGKRICRHLDGSRTNNEPDNLAWGTIADNCSDTRQHCSLAGTNNPNSFLSPKTVTTIRTDYSTKRVSQDALAAMYGTSQSHVSRIIHGDHWSLRSGASL
jgi:hypothetical protein